MPGPPHGVGSPGASIHSAPHNKAASPPGLPEPSLHRLAFLQGSPPLAPSSVPGEGTAGNVGHCCARRETEGGCLSPWQPLLPLPAGLWAGAKASSAPLLGAIPAQCPSRSCCLALVLALVHPGLGWAQEGLLQQWHCPCLVPPPSRDLQVFASLINSLIKASPERGAGCA